MANSLQKFLRNNNLPEYADMMRNRWGVRPIDADFDEPSLSLVGLFSLFISILFSLLPLTLQLVQVLMAILSRLTVLVLMLLRAKQMEKGSICDNFIVSTWSYHVYSITLSSC